MFEEVAYLYYSLLALTYSMTQTIKILYIVMFSQL